MNTISVLAGLTKDEESELNHQLKIVKTSFTNTVRALAVIYTKKLYRGHDGKRTWQEFCEQDLGFSGRYGHYFVKAFSVLEQIDQHNQSHPDEQLPYPTNLRQVRELTKSNNVIEVWQLTIKNHQVPTAKTISDTSNQIKTELEHAGVRSDVAHGIALSMKSSIGQQIIQEILQTGYLQIADEIIPANEIRSNDVERYESEIRRELFLQKVADRGGVCITIYPDDLAKTAKALIQHIQPEAISLLIENLIALTKHS